MNELEFKSYSEIYPERIHVCFSCGAKGKLKDLNNATDRTIIGHCIKNDLYPVDVRFQELKDPHDLFKESVFLRNLFVWRGDLPIYISIDIIDNEKLNISIRLFIINKGQVHFRTINDIDKDNVVEVFKKCDILLGVNMVEYFTSPKWGNYEIDEKVKLK